MNRPDWSFMLNESSCQDEITARFPRTTREAFGHYHGAPICQRVTFLQRQGAGWIGLLVVVAIVAAFALA